MKNIDVKYDEIFFAHYENQKWELPLELIQDEELSLNYCEEDQKYTLNLDLNFSFHNSNTNETATVDVTIPVKFESEQILEGRELYPAYLSGFLAVRQIISSRFINSNIGFQPDQFLPASLKSIEVKLNNSINAIEKVQMN